MLDFVLGLLGIAVAIAIIVFLWVFIQAAVIGVKIAKRDSKIEDKDDEDKENFYG